MGVSKVVYGGEVLIDISQDDVKPEYLLKGHTAHGADGEAVTGTCDYDANTQDATAVETEVLKDRTFYKSGVKKTGTMKNNGAVNGNISTKSGSYTVPQGYHDGSGKVQIAATEQQKLVPNNIREGVTVLGVTGTMSGNENEKPQSKEVTPSMYEQTILPDDGYTCLSQVTIKSIPYTESTNSAGGKTVTIG